MEIIPEIIIVAIVYSGIVLLWSICVIVWDKLVEPLFAKIKGC